MLVRVLFYGVALLCLWAALQGSFLTYQAHQFLNQPYDLLGGVFLGLATVLVLASGVLAALRRRVFYAPMFIVALAVPAFVVLGMAQMGDMSVSQAYAQATCAKGVALCFPQAGSFLRALALAAVLGGVLVLYLSHRSRGEA
jgi:hypothetical protein